MKKPEAKRHRHGYWKDKQNKLLELNLLGKKLGFTRPDDWYQVSKSTFEKHGLGRLLIIHGNSPPKLVMSLIPNPNGWKWWLFARAPRNRPMSKFVRKEILAGIGKRNGFRDQNDWYGITQKHFQSATEKRLLLSYRNSPTAAIYDLLPGASDLQFWRFKNVPRGLWRQRENRRAYFDWLTQRLNIKKPEDWYSVSGLSIKKNFGDSLIKTHYGGSAIRMVMDLARKPPPAHEWKYRKASQKYWSSAQNRSRYISWLSGILKIGAPDDWYKVKTTDFLANQGHGFVKHYAMSHIAGIKEFVRNPLGWHDFLFVGAPKQYWQKKANRVAYTKWLGRRIGFKTQADWYKITGADFQRHSGYGLLATYYGGSPPKAVMEAFPGVAWDPSRFFDRSKNQSRLFRLLKKIFPDAKILWNHKHPELKFGTGRLMELDIYIPERNLAFEYQGEQHFHAWSLYSSKATLRRQKVRDSKKRLACLNATPPIKLIEIDYKWDASEAFVRNLIARHSNETGRI